MLRKRKRFLQSIEKNISDIEIKYKVPRITELRLTQLGERQTGFINWSVSFFFLVLEVPPMP